MATATQIRERALKKLGVTSLNQTVQSEFADDIDIAYLEVHAMLDTLKLATWDYDDDVPDEFAAPVVWLVADARKDEYSVPNDRYARIVADAAKAEQIIRTMQASNVYSTPPADYF